MLFSRSLIDVVINFAYKKILWIKVHIISLRRNKKDFKNILLEVFTAINLCVK